jgi:RNA polymerase sigma-70 factor, ECF subfamily
MAISSSVMSTPPEDSDDTLVARLAVGDEDALRELMSRHARLVFSVAYRHLGGREDAEDVVQDAFTRVLKAAPRYRPDGPFRTYLLTIVTRLCLNQRARAHSRREERHDPMSAVLRRAEAAAPNPEETTLQDERSRAVRQAILALPEDQRMALILFRFEGLSYEAIASLLGRRVTAVTSLLWRARRQLRAALISYVR